MSSFPQWKGTVLLSTRRFVVHFEHLSLSSIIVSQVEDGVASRLSSILGIPTAALPVRYLGIPLTTKQINAVDYRILVEKIKQKINEWGEGFPSRLRDEEDNLIWFSSKEHSSKQFGKNKRMPTVVHVLLSFVSA
ncbi:hypothetical protein Leryth_010995 [Lithospermum erythrorhizon]|nr:hypothetical protein Leryth_010995 [Lithospermum erythrorhizon]